MFRARGGGLSRAAAGDSFAPSPALVAVRVADPPPLDDRDPLLDFSSDDDDDGGGGVNVNVNVAVAVDVDVAAKVKAEARARDGSRGADDGGLAVGFGAYEWVHRQPPSHADVSSGWTQYTDAARAMGVPAKAHFRDLLCSQRLTLRHRGLKPGDCAALAAALAVNSSVTAVDVAENALDDASVLAVVAALPSSGGPVTALDVSNNPLTDACVDAMLSSCLSGPLASLVLQDVRVTAATMYDFATAVAGGPPPSLTHLDVSKCSLTADTGESVALLVPHLQAFIAAWNELRGGAVPLMRSLATPGAALTALDVSFNGLDDAAGEAFGAALARNRVLQEVNVSHNKFTAATAAAVAAGLRANSALLALEIGFNDLTAPGSLAIISALDANTVLVELGLENCARSSAGDDPVQRLWETAAAVVNRRPLFARVSVEFPERHRVMSADAETECAGGSRRTSVESSVHTTASVVGRPWHVENSVFKHRPSECDARAFLDTPRLLGRAFEADWAATKMTRIVRRDGPRAALKVVLKAAYPLIREAFRHYCSLGGDVFVMSLAQFTSFRRDIGLDEAGRAGVYDTMFVAAMSGVAVGGRLRYGSVLVGGGGGGGGIGSGDGRLGGAAAASGGGSGGGAGGAAGSGGGAGDGGRGTSTPDAVGGSGTVAGAGVAAALSVTTGGGGSGDHHSGLARHEFLEVLVRLALVEYSPDMSDNDGPAHSMSSLLDDKLSPHLLFLFKLPSPSKAYSNVFRVNFLYTEAVDAALRANSHVIQALFTGFSEGATGRKSFLALPGYLSMFTKAGLLAPTRAEDPTRRLARLAFLLSNMTVVDEIHREERLRRRCVHTALTYTEFLEALCRFAQSWDGQMHPLGSRLAIDVHRVMGASAAAAATSDTKGRVGRATPAAGAGAGPGAGSGAGAGAGSSGVGDVADVEGAIDTLRQIERRLPVKQAPGPPDALPPRVTRLLATLRMALVKGQ